MWKNRLYRSCQRSQFNSCTISRISNNHSLSSSSDSNLGNHDQNKKCCDQRGILRGGRFGWDRHSAGKKRPKEKLFEVRRKEKATLNTIQPTYLPSTKNFVLNLIQEQVILFQFLFKFIFLSHFHSWSCSWSSSYYNISFWRVSYSTADAGAGSNWPLTSSDIIS